MLSLHSLSQGMGNLGGMGMMMGGGGSGGGGSNNNSNGMANINFPNRNSSGNNSAYEAARADHYRK